MARTKVLVTGMSGLIGGVVRRELGEKYELSALNRRGVAGVACHQADIGELEAIRPAFENQEAVVHLAAVVRADATWKELHRCNVLGTYNVFEAARQAGVRRVVFASSGAAISGWEREEPYRALAEGRYADVPDRWPMLTHLTAPRPSGLYGCSKLWGEALARHYSDTAGMSMVCLRIGAVNEQDRPLETRQYAVWCSQRDIARMIELCLEAPPELGYEVFYVTSNNRWGYRDLSHAREVLGFEPQDAAEEHRR
jgi:nucleoside-diphosphate-sugar epimerase